MAKSLDKLRQEPDRVHVGPENLAGGFDERLLVDPPSDIPKCPVCIAVLKEPHLMSCCGAHICQMCIEPLKEASEPCPCCREPNYETLLNKHLKRKILCLTVRCETSDCDWTGQLSHLMKHIIQDCRHVEALCKFGCGARYPRHVLRIHERDKCVNRPMEVRIEGVQEMMVEQLDDIESKYEKEIASLKESLKEQEKKHLKLTSEHEEEKSELGSLKVMLKEQEIKHNKISSQNKEDILSLKKDIRKQGEEIMELKLQLKQQILSTVNNTNTVTQTLESLDIPQWHLPLPVSTNNIPPCVFTMNSFSEHKTLGDVWYSAPFHSGIDGYKLCLGVHANGDNTGKGTHISLYVILMKGENDMALTWPFRGSVTILILNWRDDTSHIHGVVNFDEYTPKDWCKRIFEGERASNGRGKHRFIPHNALNYNPENKTEFLYNDSVCFKVLKVVVSA